MQNKVDTHGYIIKGLRKAARDIKDCVKRKELYFIYFNIETKEVEVNKPAGYSTKHILLKESGVYELSQQEIANMVVDMLEKA